MAEKIEVWDYPQVGLAHMDKDRDLKNRVWVQGMKFNTIVVKKPTEEISLGESEPVLEERCERDDFGRVLTGELLSGASPPPNQSLRRQQSMRRQVPSLSSVTVEAPHSMAGSGIQGAVELEAAGVVEALEAILTTALLFVCMRRGLKRRWRREQMTQARIRSGSARRWISQ